MSCAYQSKKILWIRHMENAAGWMWQQGQNKSSIGIGLAKSRNCFQHEKNGSSWVFVSLKSIELIMSWLFGPFIMNGVSFCSESVSLKANVIALINPIQSPVCVLWHCWLFKYIFSVLSKNLGFRTKLNIPLTYLNVVHISVWFSVAWYSQLLWVVWR